MRGGEGASGRAPGLGRLRRGAASLLCLGAALACAEPAPRPSAVLLIVVDALRADHLGVYGYARPTSPALDAIAARGVVFERAQASSPWTLPSFASLYTGMHPDAHGAGTRLGAAAKPDFAPLPDALPTLAETLGAAGFATAAVVVNPFLHPIFGAARGFEGYRYLFRSYVETPRAEGVVDLGLRWLAGREQAPFLLMLHLMDPHLPYDPPEGARGRFTSDYQGALRLPFSSFGTPLGPAVPASDADRRFVAGAYDEEILGVDRALGRLFAALERMDLQQKLLVVLTADHGEELFDHGAFEHGHTLHQELLHVPLIFWGAGLRPARIATPVSHVDLFPTLLDALGLPAPPGLDGASLWPLLHGGSAPPPRVLVAERMLYGPEQRAWLRWPWKAIARDGAAPLLFQLERDPAEAHDVAADHADRLAELRADAVPSKRGRAAAPRAAELDAATREQLESLGYMQR